MQFQNPGLKVPQYEGIANLGKSFDEIVNAYQMAKQRGEAANRQGVMDTLQYGAPLAGVTPQNVGLVSELKNYMLNKERERLAETGLKEAQAAKELATAKWMGTRGVTGPEMASPESMALPAPEIIDFKGIPHLVKRNEKGAVTGLQALNQPRAGETTGEREKAKAQVKAETTLATARSISNTAVKEISRALELNRNSYGGIPGATLQSMKSKMNIGQDDPKFKNTAEVINTMQNMVSKVLKSTFGGQLSDSEREYLNKIYGGLESMSIAEREIAMKRVIKTLQDKVSEAQSISSELGGNASPVKSDPMGLFK